MKAYLAIESREEGNPIQRALAHTLPVFGHEATENLDEAALVITNSPPVALAVLKGNDEVSVFIICLRRSEETAAQSLSKNFPGRVTMCGIIDVVPTIITIMGKEAS